MFCPIFGSPGAFRVIPSPSFRTRPPRNRSVEEGNGTYPPYLGTILFNGRAFDCLIVSLSPLKPAKFITQPIYLLMFHLLLKWACFLMASLQGFRPVWGGREDWERWAWRHVALLVDDATVDLPSPRLWYWGRDTTTKGPAKSKCGWTDGKSGTGPLEGRTSFFWRSWKSQSRLPTEGCKAFFGLLRPLSMLKMEMIFPLGLRATVVKDPPFNISFKRTVLVSLTTSVP